MDPAPAWSGNAVAGSFPIFSRWNLPAETVGRSLPGGAGFEVTSACLAGREVGQKAVLGSGRRFPVRGAVECVAAVRRWRGAIGLGLCLRTARSLSLLLSVAAAQGLGLTVVVRQASFHTAVAPRPKAAPPPGRADGGSSRRRCPRSGPSLRSAFRHPPRDNESGRDGGRPLSAFGAAWPCSVVPIVGAVGSPSPGLTVVGQGGDSRTSP